MIAGLLGFLVHLRLHFQLILSGIFLWAFLLAGGVPSRRATWAFAILHVLLYGGTTAYNAWYDQDEGPVTGLRHPPRAGRACLYGGLAFMVLGAGLSFTVSGAFALVYLTIMLLSIGYSHPRIRFKNGAATSLGIVAFGQGMLGFVAGATAAVAHGFPPPTRALVLGGLAATLLVTGLYPLTQVFQIDADRARGDHTFAVRFGPRTVFATTLTCFALALLTVLPAARSVFTPTEVGLLGAALAVLLVVLALWARRYDPVARLTNHDRVLGLGLVTSGCFLALILRHLIARLSS